MINLTLGRDGAPWVVIDRDTGAKLTFGTRKPSQEAILEALRRQTGKRPAKGEEVAINELTDAQ